MLITKMVADGVVKEWSLCMLLNWYKFKSQYYNFRMLNATLMATTKKIQLWQLQRKYRTSTKEKIREFKSATTKKTNHPSINGDSNVQNDRQKTTRHIENKY